MDKEYIVRIIDFRLSHMKFKEQPSPEMLEALEEGRIEQSEFEHLLAEEQVLVERYTMEIVDAKTNEVFATVME